MKTDELAPDAFIAASDEAARFLRSMGHGPRLRILCLLLEEPRATTLICGDAIPTIEHLQQGQVLASCADYDKAKESFQEAVEIAENRG